jgi:glutathione S-transferase
MEHDQLPDRPRLYGNPESGHSYKVRLMLTLANIDHDYEVIDIQLPRDKRPEPFRSYSLSRFGEVPVLLLDGHVLAQSNSILLYLAERYGVFAGNGPKAALRLREWLFWEANKIGLSLPHLRLARNYFPEEFPEGSVQWIQARYDEESTRLEKELSDGRRFVLGDDLSIADLSLCGYFFWSNQAEVQVLPKTRDWLARIASLPGWASPYRLLNPATDYQTFGRIKGEYIPVSELV